MSVHSEPSESTPLRRDNLWPQQSQSSNQLEQQQQQQQKSSLLSSTSSSSHSTLNRSANFGDFAAIENNNHINRGHENNSAAESSSDNTNSDLNPLQLDEMSDTARILTRITIDFLIILIGE